MINITCLEEKLINVKRQAKFEEDFSLQQRLVGLE